MALGDGTAWDETSPSNSSLIANGDDEIRDVRVGVRKRIEKEHTTPAGSGVGGEHREGSAKVYNVGSTPTKRPDGTTTLDSNDEGRLWMNSTTKELKHYNGTSWEQILLNNPFAILLDDGTPSTTTPGSWGIRQITAKPYDPQLICTLSANKVTLEAGTYLVSVKAFCGAVNHCQLRLYDVTHSAVLEYGGSSYHDRAMSVMGWIHLTAVLVITETTEFKVENYTELSGSGTAFGNTMTGSSGWSGNNRYLDMMITLLSR